MTFNLWYFVIGALLVAVAVMASVVKRLPLTETMIYLVVGATLGPLGAGLYSFDALSSARLLERLAEIAVIVSLFTAGLKLRMPLDNPQWLTPLRLAFASMTITVGLVTVAGVAWLGLPLGAAVLLGAVLAPTDPVLASGVQLENVRDRDRLRFSLTGEAGLNDGTAFPFVMLGLGLLGLHDLGAGGWKWWAVDVVWAIAGGLAIGAASGTVVARLVLWLRREKKEAIGRDEFLALGLIALSYGAALSPEYLRFEEIGLIALLFLLIRPLAVHVGLLGAANIGAPERWVISWFGIRGIGSLYYLAFAMNRGLPGELAWRLTALTLTTIAVSIVLHGITVTPLMNFYQKRTGERPAP